MHGILAMIHELREDTQIASNAKLGEALGIISDCADHLYSLITDILDFEMLMRDQPALNVSSLSLTDEVLQVSHTPLPCLLSLPLSGLSVSDTLTRICFSSARCTTCWRRKPRKRRSHSKRRST